MKYLRNFTKYNSYYCVVEKKIIETESVQSICGWFNEHNGHVCGFYYTDLYFKFFIDNNHFNFTAIKKISIDRHSTSISTLKLNIDGHQYYYRYPLEQEKHASLFFTQSASDKNWGLFVKTVIESKAKQEIMKSSFDASRASDL